MLDLAGEHAAGSGDEGDQREGEQDAEDDSADVVEVDVLLEVVKLADLVEELAVVEGDGEVDHCDAGDHS